MGTASFAVPPLEKLLKNGINILAVITAPDKPSGRGKKIRYSPVKSFALEHNLKLLQPTNLKDESFIKEVKSLKPDIQVVVAFRMLPEILWKIPSKGTINLHASLLPQFRGAAPINHAIIEGKKISGVTTFLIDEKIDTGRILKQVKTEIGDTDTAGELHDRLMMTGADLVLETVQDLFFGIAHPQKQDRLISKTDALSPAPKLYKEDCKINWDQKIDRVYNLIRGLSPVPCAYSTLRFKDGSKKIVKIFIPVFKNPVMQN